MNRLQQEASLAAVLVSGEETDRFEDIGHSWGGMTKIEDDSAFRVLDARPVGMT